MKLKNSNGSLPVSCGCSTALEHWERNVSKRAISCSVLRCTRTDLVGGHVIKVHGNASNEQYIVPLCMAHNHPSFTQEFEINVSVTPVRIGKLSTCKK